MKSPIANSRVSPGRNGKNNPHSTKMMTRLSQKSSLPKRSRSQFGSIQSMPSRKGWISTKAPTRHTLTGGHNAAGRDRRESPASGTPVACRRGRGHGGGAPGAVRPDAARSRRGRRRPVGGRPGRRGSSTTPSCSRDGDRRNVVDRYRYWRWRRSWPTSTPAGTPSTWPSRTGSTTSTSGRSCATPTRSWPPRCTSSATGAGTGAARWSPTATSTCATTRPPTTSRRTCTSGGSTLLGIDNLPGLRAPRDHGDAAARCASCSARRGRGCPTPAREVCDGDVLDRPVRLDPLDQRQRRRGDRDAHLDRAARRPVRRRRLARLTPPTDCDGSAVRLGGEHRLQLLQPA